MKWDSGVELALGWDRLISILSAQPIGQERAGVRGTGWKVELEDGRQVVVFHKDHYTWWLAK